MGIEPIAIIGIGCRFPGAKGPEQYWRLLYNGISSITEIPAERWDVDALYDPEPAALNKMNTRWGGFIENVDQFDPQFFKISPREAINIDPQQRLLLEVVWEAMEDAGLVMEQLAGTSVGVFIGIGTSDYNQIQIQGPYSIDSYTSTGLSFSIAANRISYVFDFKGPSIALDTACSASLVTVHLACQSLRAGESSIALAGGVNLMLSPWTTVGLSKLGALSPDGRCSAFDARANGYVRGEGAGVIILKPLSKALADGDRIYALIRGSAVNQDGRSNGLTAPNRWAQESVLREAYQQAGISPGQVQYVEAHGTGTLLGDPIEVKALGSVLAADRPSGSYCALGSVKTNIGHLESAAGIAGLIKVALALKHRAIPPSLNFHEPNPHIPFKNLPLRVQQQLGPWPSHNGPALAGVSSFAFGGTNSHVALEEAPPERSMDGADERVQPGVAQLLPLSAHSPESLQALARAYSEILSEESVSAVSLHDMCYTASARRTHHDYRLALTFNSRAELIEGLDSFLSGETLKGISSGRKHPSRRSKLVFVFPGQGSQWPGMARGLMEHEPVFRKALEQCEDAMRPFVDWSLLRELSVDDSQSRLEKIDVIQPTLFAIQVALAALWRSWGIKPDAVVGHSMGEVAAACVADVLSLEDAARIICLRSRLMKQLSGQGSMAVVELSLEQAQLALTGYDDRLAIAASNSPTTTVLSGDSTALDELTEKLLRQDIFCRPVKVDVASHSPQMDSLRADLLSCLHGLSPKVASTPIYSTVVGRAMDEISFDADYWARNLREPVLFSGAVEELVKNGHDIFLELSPHPILLNSIQQVLAHLGREGVTVASLRREQDEPASMLNALGALYTQGHSVDWSALYPKGGRLVPLPSYPWQRERYWLKTTDLPHSEWTLARQGGGARHPLLGHHLKVAHPAGTHIWEVELDKRFLPYLADHQIHGAMVLPGAAYLEMALAAVTEAFGEGFRVLTETEFRKALFLPENSTQKVQVVLSHSGNKELSLQIYSHQGTRPPEELWTLHAAGKVHYEKDESVPDVSAGENIEEIKARCTDEISTEDYYLRLRERGMQYGHFFQGIEQLWRGEAEALGKLRVATELEAEVALYQVHPTILDASFQILGAAIPDELIEGDSTAAFLPMRVEQVRVHSRPGLQLWGHARLRTDPKLLYDSLVGDIYLFDEDGKVTVEVLGLHCQRLDQDAHHIIPRELDEWLYKLKWQPKPHAEEEHASETATPTRRGSWLIFADSAGVGHHLASLLKAQGEKCFTVYPGETCDLMDEDRLQINPARPEDFEQLLKNLSEVKPPSALQIIHLWSIDAPSTEEMSLASLDLSQALGCGSVLYSIQAVARMNSHEAASLWLVTRGSQALTGDSVPTATAQAPLWGFGRAVAQEHPEFWGGLIDLDPSGSTSEAAAFLKAEIQRTDGEDQIAFRHGQRYVARLSREHESALPASPFRWRPEASYLITGGLGDLGLAVARWMAMQGARRLILLGRTKLPPRSQWKYVTDETPLAHQVAAIREIEALGASIHIASVDVADETALTSFLEQFHQEGWPPIRGVIHAAAVLRDRTLLQMEAATLAEVLRPKVAGGWLLHRLLDGAALDFFVLFSSAASLLGSAGQANYAAANAYLDALAHYRQALGQPALSINWGPWAEIGLAARPDRGGRLALQGVGSILPEYGLEALGRLLSQSSAQLAVVPINWRQWREFNPVSEIPLLSQLAMEEASIHLEASGLRGTSRLTRDALLAAEPAERHRLLEAHLAEQAAKLLGLSAASFDVQQPLIALGMDSLMALQLKNRIEAETGVVVPVVKFLQGPSVADLAVTVLDQLARTAPATLDDLPSPTASTGERHRLKDSSRARPEAERKEFVAPRIPTEERLAAFLAEALGLERISIHDDLFELEEHSPRGGLVTSGEHSSFAELMLSRAREDFQVELPFDRLIGSPTVAQLAVAIVKTQAEQVGAEEVSQLLTELERLSDEEARSLIAN